MKKKNYDEQAELLLSKLKEVYEPKNQFIDKIILSAQNDLSKGQIPQVVMKRVVSSIYQIVFVEKITVGDNAYEVLKEMDKLSRSNGWLPFNFVPHV